MAFIVNISNPSTLFRILTRKLYLTIFRLRPTNNLPDLNEQDAFYPQQLAQVLKNDDKPNIFLITSTIRTSQNALSYTSTRSVYSVQERLEQTLHTIQSVRTKLADNFIILLENSALTQEEQEILRTHVDWFVSFADDEQAAELRDGLFKNAAEVYVLLKILPVVRFFKYEKLFKLSGRYWLSDRFDIENFPPDRFGVLNLAGSFSTRLYCVPKSLEVLYAQQMKRTLVLTKLGATMENVYLNGVSSKNIQELPFLGVAGHIAVDGTLIDE